MSKKTTHQYGYARVSSKDQIDEVAEQIRNNKMSLRQGGKILGVSYTTSQTQSSAKVSPKPKTGDNSNVALYVLIMAGGAAIHMG